MSTTDTEQHSSAVAVVQEQLDAYNARDLQRLSAVYGEHVTVFQPPRIDPSIVGRSALLQFYGTQRFGLPGLHAQLLHRIVLSDLVVDHRRIAGVEKAKFEVVAVYAVHGGKIQSVWFFSRK